MTIFSSVISRPLFRIAQKTPAFSFFLSPYDIAISQRAVHVVGNEITAIFEFQTPFKNGTTEQQQTMTQYWKNSSFCILCITKRHVGVKIITWPAWKRQYVNNNMSILLCNNRTGYNEGVWGILGFFHSSQRLFIFLKLVPFPLSYTSFPQIPSGGGEASFKVVGQLRTRTTSAIYNMSGLRPYCTTTYNFCIWYNMVVNLVMACDTLQFFIFIFAK